MQTPSIAASGTFRQEGDIPLIRARTLSITARITFHSSATKGATVYLYYSPDGTNWDTIAYTSFEITLTAGQTVQRTLPIDVPEHGYIKVHVTNDDSSYAATDLKCWYTIQSWMPKPMMERGKITADTGEENS